MGDVGNLLHGRSVVHFPLRPGIFDLSDFFADFSVLGTLFPSPAVVFVTTKLERVFERVLRLCVRCMCVCVLEQEYGANREGRRRKFDGVARRNAAKSRKWPATFSSSSSPNRAAAAAERASGATTGADYYAEPPESHILHTRSDCASLALAEGATPQTSCRRPPRKEQQ